MTLENKLSDLNDVKLRNRAVRAAQSQEPFDVLIINGEIVDMVTGQLREADIGFVGPLIASVHPRSTRSDAGQVIDASGLMISPGLIDMHMHIESSMITPSAYCEQVLPRGVTTIVWDPHEYGNTCGMDGVNYATDAAKKCAVKVITLAPSCVPSAPGFETTGGDFTPAIVEKLLSKPEIHGVAEVMSMQAVLDRDDRMSGIIQAGLESGKRICGHARGLSGSSLNAYVTAGVETDHELTSAADLLEKLQAGLTIELRGSHDHLLPQFVDALNQLGHLPQTITLCTDDVFIDDLVNFGGLDDVVRRLVKYGMPPIWALQAATFNAANRLGRSDLGLIAPGKRADLVLFDDLDNFKAIRVLVNGVPIEKDASQPIAVPPPMKKTMAIKPLKISDFQVAANGENVTISTIENPRFTKWGKRIVKTKNGCVVPPKDATLMAIVNRFGADSGAKLAFLINWGKWDGAFATTVSHDSHNLTVFGGNEEDLALAANTVIEMGGGLAVVSKGQVLAQLALPIAGLVTEKATELVAEEFKDIRAAMDKIVTWNPPYLVFKACFGASLVCNSGPHLSDLGIVDTVNDIILVDPSAQLEPKEKLDL